MTARSVFSKVLRWPSIPFGITSLGFSIYFGTFVMEITAVQDRGQQMRHVLKTWDLGRGSGV